MRVVSAVNMGSYGKSRIAGTVCVRVNSHGVQVRNLETVYKLPFVRAPPLPLIFF